MYNYFMLVGYIETNLEEIRTENMKMEFFHLKVTRPFKNNEGKYETDIFELKVSEPITSIIKENFNKGDVIGVKGRILPTPLNNYLYVEKIINFDKRD